MNIDEKVLQSLIEKEIKSQVEKKMKAIGRNTILEIYKDSVQSVVKGILFEKSKEAEDMLKSLLLENKDKMMKDVSEKIADKFTYSIKSAFLNENNYNDDYDDDDYFN